MLGCFMQYQKLTPSCYKVRTRPQLLCVHLEAITIKPDQDLRCSLQILMEIMDLTNNFLSTHSILCTRLRCFLPICSHLLRDKINNFTITACNNTLKCLWTHTLWTLMACTLPCSSSNSSNDLEMMTNKASRFTKLDPVRRRLMLVQEKSTKKNN